MRFTIYGPPRTKKTHNRIVRAGRFPKVLPSKAYEEWNKVALVQLAEIRQIGRKLPLFDGPVHLRAIFYRAANRRDDLAGYMQALADTLQEAAILADDSMIESWDGTRKRKDKDNPRVEVEVARI